MLLKTFVKEKKKENKEICTVGNLNLKSVTIQTSRASLNAFCLACEFDFFFG